MKKVSLSFVRRAYKNQSGQALVMAALCMVAFMGVAGFTIDIGHAYVVRNQLQISTNAAGLAAAGDVFVSRSLTDAQSIALAYATANSVSGLSLNSGYPQVKQYCVQVLADLSNSKCTTSSSANALQVTEQVSMPTTFMRIFGVNSLTINATSFASMLGNPTPWNIAIIMDATGSMSGNDSNCNNVTQFQCALEGVRTILSNLPACTDANGSNCNPGNANIRIALFAFPNMLTKDLSWANQCKTGSYNAEYSGYTNPPTPYTVLTLPPKVSKTNTSGYTPVSYTMTLSGLGTGQTVNGDVFGTTVSGAKNGTTIAWGSSSWEVTYAPSVTTTDTNPDQNGFVSDYYDATSTKTNKMNTSSYLVKAVGYQDNANCLRWAPNSTAFNNGQAKGGNSTYYAAAMYAAQEALEREHVDHPDAKSAIIILGDGGQAAMTKYFPAGTDAAVTSTSASTCTLDDNSTVKNTKTCPKNFSSKLASKSSGYDTLTTTGDYPSALDQCQQSIQAAHDIQDSKLTSTGTKVFSVAYGAASSGCYTETSTKVTSGLNVAIGSVSDVTPCTTMQNLATDLNHFYSDPYQSGSGSTCYDTVHKDISTMAQIFLDITANFRNPRLLPSNTTGILISN